MRSAGSKYSTPPSGDLNYRPGKRRESDIRSFGAAKSLPRIRFTRTNMERFQFLTVRFLAATSN
jgi:hypothetical protein